MPPNSGPAAEAGRDVGEPTLVVDAHDQAVDAGTQVGEVELKGHLGAGVGTELWPLSQTVAR